jgi:ABC-type Fe3+/spermidine/putrescine transport system ATPase subunit
VDTRLGLRSELKDIQKKFGTTMIYITHDQEEAFAMSDRIMVMEAGRIHQLDTPKNLIDEPADEYVKTFVIKNINTKINSLIQFARSSEND